MLIHNNISIDCKPVTINTIEESTLANAGIGDKKLLLTVKVNHLTFSSHYLQEDSSLEDIILGIKKSVIHLEDKLEHENDRG